MGYSYSQLRLKAKINPSRSPVTVHYDPEVALGSALKAYWEAADYGTSRVTDDGGGLISSWKDRKLGLDLVAATTARPIYSTDYVNGEPAFLFDGVANFMRVASTTGLPTGADAGQIWVLHEGIGTTSALTFIASYGGATSGTQRRLGRSNGSERLAVSDATTNTNATGNEGLITAGAGHMSMGRWSGTTQEGRNRGQVTPAATTIATLNTGTTRATIGANNSNTAASFWNGAITAILITDDTLTLTQRQQLESWGYRRAGHLDYLPDDHPFKHGPDGIATFTPTPTTNFFFSNPALQPFLLDFRESYYDQIKVSSGGQTWVYGDDGSNILVPKDRAAWKDHDPVTGDPLGLRVFAGTTIYNTDRTLSAPVEFVYNAVGLLPVYPAWYDSNASLAVYALGSGQINLTFSQPVEVLRADGTSETDWGLPAVYTTSIDIDCVDELTEGWWTGVHYFEMPRSPSATTVTMTKIGGATVTYCEAAKSVAGPPQLSGNRPTLRMESTWAATGLPRSPTAFTFCYLTKVSHCTQGGEWWTIDDNDLANPLIGVTGTVTKQPVRRLGGNYLANPRFDGEGRKSGFMGLTAATENYPGFVTGVDPQNLRGVGADIIQKMKWRCFFGTFNFVTGETAVACNGEAVERNTLDTRHFPDNFRKMRWGGLAQGGLAPDGWMAANYLSAEDLTGESDATLSGLCSPTGGTGLFGDFDPD